MIEAVVRDIDFVTREAELKSLDCRANHFG
jgi:hypothetical protein